MSSPFITDFCPFLFSEDNIALENSSFYFMNFKELQTYATLTSLNKKGFKSEIQGEETKKYSFSWIFLNEARLLALTFKSILYVLNDFFIVFSTYLAAISISQIQPRKRGNNLWPTSLMVFWVWHNKHSSFQKYPWWTWPHTQWSKEPKFSWVAFEDPEIVINNAVRQTWWSHCKTLGTQWTRSLQRTKTWVLRDSVSKKKMIWVPWNFQYRFLLRKTFLEVSLDWTKRES